MTVESKVSIVNRHMITTPHGRRIVLIGFLGSQPKAGADPAGDASIAGDSLPGMGPVAILPDDRTGLKLL
ncbi:protein of unknown function [Candidatus Nitrospira inopinata]|uniref:Uncharacterized protein n=1 Tax=Candidatus Nitrospira inopinata TaxID=1715989 RepID=A0A0S4KL07_9BACT|nr:protein of unknown function [Candidatus Nitrospira inopinata]